MKKEQFTRYVLDGKKITTVKVDKEKAIKEIDELLKKDKAFLDIMSKL